MFARRRGMSQEDERGDGQRVSKKGVAGEREREREREREKKTMRGIGHTGPSYK